MKTKEEKLEALKAFLKENNIPFEENHYSKLFKVRMCLRIKTLKIAVFFSEGPEKDSELVYKKNKFGASLNRIYNPFFIRENETEEFILEKMQNCVFDRMIQMQKHWQKKQNKK